MLFQIQSTRLEVVDYVGMDFIRLQEHNLQEGFHARILVKHNTFQLLYALGTCFLAQPL
jgi:hypothetical protein